MELLTSVVDSVAGGLARSHIGAWRFLLFGRFGTFQSFGAHLCAHVTEDDRDHLAVRAFNASYGGQPFDAYGVSDIQGVFGFRGVG